MVTDLCQSLGSGSSVCLCVFLLGRQDGDRFVSGAWVWQFCVFVCVSIRLGVPAKRLGRAAALFAQILAARPRFWMFCWPRGRAYNVFSGRAAAL